MCFSKEEEKEGIFVIKNGIRWNFALFYTFSKNEKKKELNKNTKKIYIGVYNYY